MPEGPFKCTEIMCAIFVYESIICSIESLLIDSVRRSVIKSMLTQVHEPSGTDSRARVL